MPNADPRQNHLLATLKNTEQRERIFAGLEFIDLPLNEVLYQFGTELEHVYFPTDAIVSLLYVMENGASTEIALVGNDGMVGVALLMGGITMPGHARVQVAGHAFRLGRRQFQDEFHRQGNLQNVMLFYTQALLIQTSQTAACNNHHSVQQRLCRWLLLCLDRLPDHKLTMTHELMSGMLGVRREGVTEAAGQLQEAGAIRYSRGHIEVLDRDKLEALSCECYDVVKRETDRLSWLLT